MSAVGLGHCEPYGQREANDLSRGHDGRIHPDGGFPQCRFHVETSLLRLPWLLAPALSASRHRLAPGSNRRHRRSRQQAPQWTPVFTEIRRGVGQYMGRGGTIGYLINAGGVVVVDSQFPDSAKACVDGITERSKNRGGIDSFTTITAITLAETSRSKGAAKKVVAHEFAANLIKQAASSPTAENLCARYNVHALLARADWRRMGAGEMHGRAHTGGDAVITFERANAAHLGDLMFNRRVPVIDRVNGAIVANWVNVLEKAAADHAADTIHIFGHAGSGHPVMGGRAELMYFRDYLTALLNPRAAAKAGQTKEQFTATTPTLTGFEAFGAHAANTLGIVYDEVTEAK